MLRSLFAITILVLLISFGCKPADTNKAANDQQPSAQSPSQPANPAPPNSSANTGSQTDDRQAIENLVNQAANDLVIAINQKDFNRLDKYFDTDDPVVKNRLAKEKQLLRRDAS